MIYSVLIGKFGQASRSRPSRSFRETHAFSGKNLHPAQTARKIIICSGYFSSCPTQLSSPSLSAQINDILLLPSPFKSVLYFPHLLHHSLLDESLKSLSISAFILTASSFPMAFHLSAQQRSSAGTVTLDQQASAQPPHHSQEYCSFQRAKK